MLTHPDEQVARLITRCKSKELMEHAITGIKEALAGDFDLAGCNTQEALVKRLAEGVNELIQRDFHRLVALLYRLDIPEEKLRNMLKQPGGTDAGTLIAGLIVERQLQKQKSREMFRGAADIPEEDKW